MSPLTRQRQPDKVLAEKLAHVENPTERRKRARQAARCLLPNATETRLVWSANARAIRHLLEQRGSRHADAEIRAFANRLLDIMQAEAPLLFGDHETVPLEDGNKEIVTRWKKV